MDHVEIVAFQQATLFKVPHHPLQSTPTPSSKYPTNEAFVEQTWFEREAIYLDHVEIVAFQQATKKASPEKRISIKINNGHGIR